MLERLTQAAEARRTAEREYRSAVLAAVDTHGIPATARAAGVTRQAIGQLVKRARAETDVARQRLAELDQAYETVVATQANGYTPKDGAAITARRNGQAAKRRRRGLPALPTLKEEALSLAETQVLEKLRAGFAVDGFTADDLYEATALRERLEANENAFPF